MPFYVRVKYFNQTLKYDKLSDGYNIIKSTHTVCIDRSMIYRCLFWCHGAMAPLYTYSNFHRACCDNKMNKLSISGINADELLYYNVSINVIPFDVGCGTYCIHVAIVVFN